MDRIRILVVDDDVRIRRVVERTLQTLGHEVISTGSGDEALRLSTDHAFDLALVDLQLGEQRDGLEVLARLRELQPACLRLLVTGAWGESVDNALQRGAVEKLIRKPFQEHELVQAVQDSLENRGRMMEMYRVQAAASAASERKALEETLGGDQLSLAFQPILVAGSEEIFGYEALLRSRNPVLEGPLSVVRAARRQGVIAQLSVAVVRLAAEWKTAWPGLRLFLNLHPDELTDPENLFARLGPLVPWADRVVLEFPEFGLGQVVDTCNHARKGLQQLGFDLAVDDLGSGARSLQVLAELRPKYLKLGMGVVRGVHQNARRQRNVTLACQLAKALDGRVVAVGIEDLQEAQCLEDQGVELLQGYYFGRPGVGPSTGTV